MLRTLVAVQLRSAAQGIYSRAQFKRKTKTGSKILFALLFVYVIVSLSASLGFYFHTLMTALRPAGLMWLYFALAGIAAFVFGLLGSVFLAQSSLYQAKDSALLLSLPIRPRDIYLARVLVLYIITLLVQALMMLPAMVVALAFGAAGPASLPFFLFAALLLPLPVLALAMPLGYALARIASRVRRKNLLITLLSLAFLALYFILYSRVMADMQKLLENAARIAGSVRGAALPAYHLGRAVSEGNPMSLMLYALFCLLPFMLSAFLTALGYQNTLTAARGAAKQEYKGGGMQAHGQFKALTLKEMKRFLGSPVYLMNAGIGLVFMLGLPLYLLFDSAALASIRGMGLLDKSQEGMAAALSMLAGSVFISSASISLEGKQLWLAQSLPIAPAQWLKSKAAAHLLICLPPIAFAGVLLAIKLQMNLAEALLCLALPSLVAAFCALAGLVINLRFPKLHWQSETEPVKQSLSTFLAMSLGFLTPAALTAQYALLLKDDIGPLLYGALCAALLLLAALLLWRHLRLGASDAMLDLSEA